MPCITVVVTLILLKAFYKVQCRWAFDLLKMTFYLQIWCVRIVPVLSLLTLGHSWRFSLNASAQVNGRYYINDSSFAYRFVLVNHLMVSSAQSIYFPNLVCHEAVELPPLGSISIVRLLISGYDSYCWLRWPATVI